MDLVFVPTTSEWNSWSGRQTRDKNNTLINVLLAKTHTADAVGDLDSPQPGCVFDQDQNKDRLFQSGCHMIPIQTHTLSPPAWHVYINPGLKFPSPKAPTHTRPLPQHRPSLSMVHAPRGGQRSTKRQRSLTLEAALGLQVANTEAKHRQLVQAAPDLLGERQQTGQAIQLHVQAVPVAFGRIGLHRWRLHTLKMRPGGAFSSC